MEPRLLSPDSATTPVHHEAFGATVIQSNQNEPASEELNAKRYSQEGSGADIADIGTPHGDEGHPFAATARMDARGEYGILNNFTYDSDNKSLLSTAPIVTPKRYDYHESRKFLFKAGVYRFVITFLFCASIGLSLEAFEGYKKPRIMSKVENRVFNALMLGLSLGLGLNLASSLKRYAVILRWSLLTKRYVSLEVFDLILGLETLTKVGKLMVISLPGIRKVKALRKLP